MNHSPVSLYKLFRNEQTNSGANCSSRRKKGVEDSRQLLCRDTHTDSLRRLLPAGVTNDSDLLIYRCGTPTKVLDTSEDDPRPPIVTRVLTYQKAHLRFVYVPKETVDNPPTYTWKLMGLIDTKTNQGITPGDMQRVLSRRLPCMLANQK